jgi:hypothetical protein
VIVHRDGAVIRAILHWQGGDHTEIKLKQRLNAVGRHNPRIPDDTIALMRELARLMPDRQIAFLLNRIKVLTGNGVRGAKPRARRCSMADQPKHKRRIFPVLLIRRPLNTGILQCLPGLLPL